MEDSRSASPAVVLEIRQGVGGDEAGLFAFELLEMYRKFAQKKECSCEIMESEANNAGGIKYATIKITGPQVNALFSHEAGVHRVQRVPATERSGRLHTSTASVAVIPYIAESAQKITINPADLQISTARASGPGGQHVNRTDSAIRIFHKPSGITVFCQDERSQHKNREKAFKVLRLKLYLAQEAKQHATLTTLRREQIQTQDRSFKIRTYHFKQNRVTDHRLKKSFPNTSFILDGNLDNILKHYQK